MPQLYEATPDVSTWSGIEAHDSAPREGLAR